MSKVPDAARCALSSLLTKGKVKSLRQNPDAVAASTNPGNSFLIELAFRSLSTGQRRRNHRRIRRRRAFSNLLQSGRSDKRSASGFGLTCRMRHGAPYPAYSLRDSQPKPVLTVVQLAAKKVEKVLGSVHTALIAPGVGYRESRCSTGRVSPAAA